MNALSMNKVSSWLIALLLIPIATVNGDNSTATPAALQKLPDCAVSCLVLIYMQLDILCSYIITGPVFTLVSWRVGMLSNRLQMLMREPHIQRRCHNLRGQYMHH